MIRLYLTDASSLEDEVFQRWLPRISPEKAARLLRMPREKAKPGMAGELLVRYGMWKTFGIPPGELVTEADERGKPRVLSHKGVHFNISHSGSLCLCAVGDRPLGVDLQQMKNARCEQLAGRIFTEEEMAAFLAAGGTREAFFATWARKEAVSKLTGAGLSGFKHQAAVEYRVVLETAYGDCRLCVVCAP